MGILDFSFVDFLDILITAYILYFLYIKIKGTMAMNIFVGLFIIYLIWLIVSALDMSLISTILSKVSSAGAIALVVIFQQELRKFLLDLGNKYALARMFSIERIFNKILKKDPQTLNITEIVKACVHFKKNKIGALIILPVHSDLQHIIETGERMDCNISFRILDSIFFKNAPLHDGAVVVVGGRIVAAKCVLPVSDSRDLPKKIGLRHRSGIGISEVSDSLVIIVSEERGEISYAEFGSIVTDITAEQLADKLKERFITEKSNLEYLASAKLFDVFKMMKN